VRERPQIGAELPLSCKSEQQGRSDGDSGYHQTRALHRFVDRRLMRTNPSVFWIVLRGRVEPWETLGSFAGFAQSHLENFGQVERVPIGFLRNLLAATEAIGHDQPIGRSLADGGQKFEFANGFRDAIFFFFEAECSSHAAAPGGGGGEGDAHAVENSFFRSHLHNGFVMAMSVNERSARQPGQGEISGVLLKKFTQEEDLL
jgi:hypothetical protein